VVHGSIPIGERTADVTCRPDDRLGQVEAAERFSDCLGVADLDRGRNNA
jgi:hypothetical protein